MSKLIEKYVAMYHGYKNKYGANTAILMLVGSFYELYDLGPEDAGAPDIGQAGGGADGDYADSQEGKWSEWGGYIFAGFPEPQLHKFANLLTRENWTVVVVDQKKNARGRWKGERLCAFSLLEHMQKGLRQMYFMLGGSG